MNLLGTECRFTLSKKSILEKHTIDLWAPGFGAGGGIQAFSQEVANALNDLNPRLIARDRYHRPSNFLLSSRLASCRFAIALVRHAAFNRPCLIVSTHVNFGPVASILQRALGIPYVLVAHGIDIAADLTRSRKAAIKNASKIVAVSKHTANRVSALMGVPMKDIALLPNTVDEVRYSIGQRDVSLLRKFGIPENRKLILTVGRLSASEQYKGYDVIIRAMPRILEAAPNAHYVLCGAGDDRDRVTQLVNDTGLQQHITMTGFLPTEDLPAMYRCANVFAMPSTGEGFGIVYLEAMASGVPVLAGNRDGSVDALADGELGKLIDPLNVKEVADGIIELLQRRGPAWWFEPKLIRERMLSKFGRPQFSRSLHAIIENTLAKVSK